MKVSELIEELKKFPANLDVHIESEEDYDYNYPVSAVRLAEHVGIKRKYEGTGLDMRLVSRQEIVTPVVVVGCRSELGITEEDV